MANLINQTENQNFLALRKELGLMSVTVYPEMMVYKLTNHKIATSVAERANKIIARLNLPLEAKANAFPSETMVIRELEVCHD